MPYLKTRLSVLQMRTRQWTPKSQLQIEIILSGKALTLRVSRFHVCGPPIATQNIDSTELQSNHFNYSETEKEKLLVNEIIVMYYIPQ